MVQLAEPQLVPSLYETVCVVTRVPAVEPSFRTTMDFVVAASPGLIPEAEKDAPREQVVEPEVRAWASGERPQLASTERKSVPAVNVLPLLVTVSEKLALVAAVTIAEMA